jgi:phosphatidylinositol alpha-1,6-mannosyltransferase
MPSQPDGLERRSSREDWWTEPGDEDGLDTLASSTYLRSMAEVLFVSKPVAPPWNDSSKNLVRDLADSLERYRPVVMGTGAAAYCPARGRVEPTYSHERAAFSPSLANNARVLRRLTLGPRVDLWHFFFAPNRRSSQAAWAASRLRRVPTVQTVTSAPKADADPRQVLFGHRVVVLSRGTLDDVVARGAEPARLVRIPPSVRVPHVCGRAEGRRAFGLPASAAVVTYAGDLEVGGGAELSLEAFRRLSRRDTWLVMACRAKTDAASAVERRLRSATDRLSRTRTVWVGETGRIHDLLAASDLVILPARSLYAKMDYPLVLLEAMSLGVPVLVARGTPAEELGDNGAAWVVEPDAEAIAACVRRALDDTTERMRVGEAGRARVAHDHTPQAMANAYERLYDSLLIEGGKQVP